MTNYSGVTTTLCRQLPVFETLFWFAMALSTLSGCGRLEALAMVEERPVTVQAAPGCYTSPTAPRGWHYRSQLDMGERPASSSRSGQVSAIHRNIPTHAVDSGYSLGTALLAGEILVVCIALILALFVLAAFKEKQMRKGVALTVVLAGLGVSTVVLGYLSGSVLSLDNPSDLPVRVTVDGRTVVDVPARSFTDVRVWGPNVSIQAETGGQPLEQLTLAIDGNPVGTLMRAVFGDGRYIYAVCGGNSYSLGHYTYR